MRDVGWTTLRQVGLAGLVAWWPAVASASGGQAGSGQYGILILLTIVGIAYLVTHLLLERLARRYGFVTGVEYIVLGAILGPVIGLLDASRLTDLTPAIVLGTGSLGLLAGLYIDFDAFDRAEIRALKSATAISLVTLICVVGAATALLYYVWDPTRVAAAMPGLLCLGAIAMVADSGPIRAMAVFLGAEGPAADFGMQVARYCSSIGIVAFGMIFCFYNDTAVPFPVAPSLVGPVWFGIHLLLGIVLGLVFATFLRRDLSDDKIITVVIGMVIFSSGFAYYLKLSPIFVNFIMGVVLINTGRHAEHVKTRLSSIRRPLYIVLFFFAGAGWYEQVPSWQVVGTEAALIAGYVLLRRGGRFVGSIAATRLAAVRSYGAGLSRALVAPGALSVAMLLNFEQIFGHDTSVAGLAYLAELYNGLLIAIVLTEIAAYPMTRSWLIDVADVAPPDRRNTDSSAAGEAG